ncbi:unnamed protein product, partial [Musa acuminata subsp. burmannicoides]
QQKDRYQFKSGLPSLMSTKTLPPSLLEILSSSSSGGCPEMVLTTDDAAFWMELMTPLNGERSTFCPRNSTLSGTTMSSVSCG